MGDFVRVAPEPLVTDLQRWHVPRAAALEQATTDDLWAKIAALHTDDAKLDEASTAFVRGQNPNAAQAGRLAMTKSRAEDPILRLVAKFQDSIALDTVRNEYQLHRRIHEGFVREEWVSQYETLNSRVYADLFLTPRSDPWLGLASPDVYTALRNGGVVADRGR
jgi:hypothetical protein